MASCDDGGKVGSSLLHVILYDKSFVDFVNSVYM